MALMFQLKSVFQRNENKLMSLVLEGKQQKGIQVHKFTLINVL